MIGRKKNPNKTPLAVLLLPGPLDQFILIDQAKDLLKAERVVAVEPSRLPYGALARLPQLLADGIATRQARRLGLALPGVPRVLVMFHPFQYPLARAVVASHKGCELWYGIWDHFEEAYSANAKTRSKLKTLHMLASERSSFTFTVNDALAEIELGAGRDATVVTQAADSFPAPKPDGRVIAISLGHQGHRNDWKLLHGVIKAMPELTLLLVGEAHDNECKNDPDYWACRKASNVVWLGWRSVDEAAQLILCADVGIVPFERSAFNEAGLPNRIIKYARLGRATIAPPLRGLETWGNAVHYANTVDDWVDALRAQAGTRVTPHAELREWALGHTARKVNEQLWERLIELEIANDCSDQFVSDVRARQLHR